MSLIQKCKNNLAQEKKIDEWITKNEPKTSSKALLNSFFIMLIGLVPFVLFFYHSFKLCLGIPVYLGILIFCCGITVLVFDGLFFVLYYEQVKDAISEEKRNELFQNYSLKQTFLQKMMNPVLIILIFVGMIGYFILEVL